VHRRQRGVVGRNVGLAVQLQDQRDLAGVVPEELLRQPDLDRDPVELPFDRKLLMYDGSDDRGFAKKSRGPCSRPWSYGRNNAVPFRSP
jgi:hypothetical protein